MANQYDYSQISSTARLGAYFRKFSDIPLSEEISDLVDGESATRDILRDVSIARISAFFLEARYKLLDYFLAQNQDASILEYGCAFFPRAMLLPEDRFYLGFDLPGVIQERARIANILGREYPSTHKDVACSVLDTDRVETEVITHLPADRPIRIIHEMLLPHFNKEENERLMTLNHRLLQRFGGTWINMDVVTKEWLNATYQRNPKAYELITRINGTTNRGFMENAYDNDSQYSDVLSQHSLIADVQALPVDKIKVSSFERTGIPIEERPLRLKALTTSKAWLITAN